MVTLEQAKSCNMFHYAPACTTTRVERWRRNGATKLWKRSPERFQVPVKFGMYSYSHITDLNADDFHCENDCPLRSENDNY